MNTNLLDLNNDVLNIIGDYVKKDKNEKNSTCARRRQLGWFVSGLPWGLEPHDIPIREQWGGR